jgi:hypothetical protein
MCFGSTANIGLDSIQNHRTPYGTNVVQSGFSLLPQTTDCAPDSDRTSSVHGVSTTGLHLPTVLASPDSNCFPLHSKLATELAEVLGVLGNLHLLDLLTQTGTIPGTIFANDSCLLGALRLHKHHKQDLNRAQA